MSDSLIKYAVRGGVAKLTFNRPQQLNAMNTRMMEQIITALKQMQSDDAVYVGILTGAGKAFMAGADIKEYANCDAAGFRAFQRQAAVLYSAICDCPQPMVAAVNGYALGGGFEIALACDLILASDNAKLGLPEIKIGLIPGGGGTLRLAQAVGHHRAMDMVMTGRFVEAAELCRAGLISHVYAVDDFEEAVDSFAAQLASQPPMTLRAIKRLARYPAGAIEPAWLKEEAQALEQAFATPQARACIAAFQKKDQEDVAPRAGSVSELPR